MPNVIVVAIDIGGTFTDLIGFDTQEQRFLQAKSLTTPSNLVQGIIDCLNKSGLDIGDISELIHGSTTAINTLIERKGAKTGLIVTRGTRDVYAIGRGNRPESYNLFFQRPKPLVSRALTARSTAACWPPATNMRRWTRPRSPPPSRPSRPRAWRPWRSACCIPM